VPKALGDFLVLDAVRSTGGTAIAVTDDELLAAQAALARDEGTWICPEGAACFAAVGQLRESGWLRDCCVTALLRCVMSWPGSAWRLDMKIIPAKVTLCVQLRRRRG
jgi:hypothetical protein